MIPIRRPEGIFVIASRGQNPQIVTGYVHGTDIESGFSSGDEGDPVSPGRPDRGVIVIQLIGQPSQVGPV